MKAISKWLEKYRLAAGKRGYTCDACGREVFSYPYPRLCSDCLGAIKRNEGNRCSKCGRQAATEGVCLECKRVPPAFSRGFSPFAYEGKTALLLNRLKNGQRWLSSFFGEEMAAEWKSYAEKRDSTDKPLIIPVPMTETRIRSRGYNQSAELAKSIAAVLGTDADEGVLIKNRETLPQKGLRRVERRENVSGAYRSENKGACKGRTILLIDDLMTTGATGSECARVLTKSGAKEVFFFTAASLPERK